MKTCVSKSHIRLLSYLALNVTVTVSTSRWIQEKIRQYGTYADFGTIFSIRESFPVFRVIRPCLKAEKASWRGFQEGFSERYQCLQWGKKKHKILFSWVQNKQAQKKTSVLAQKYWFDDTIPLKLDSATKSLDVTFILWSFWTSRLQTALGTAQKMNKKSTKSNTALRKNFLDGEISCLISLFEAKCVFHFLMELDDCLADSLLLTGRQDFLYPFPFLLLLLPQPFQVCQPTPGGFLV